MSLHSDPHITDQLTKDYFKHKSKDRIKAHSTALKMRVHGNFDTVHEAISFMDNKRTFMRRKGTWHESY